MSSGHHWLEASFAEIRPRALAGLCRQFRDLELAEESFSIACLRAVDKWPADGLPDDPFAWLFTVARNAGLDSLRRNTRHNEKSHLVESEYTGQSELPEDVIDERAVRDDVLRLLFICCHPALTPQDQSALALRIVVGLSVQEIASAFLVKVKTMEQRITRAKRTVADTPVAFETPDLIERNKRLNTVMLMLYLQFNEGWSASAGETQIKQSLCEESIRLARLLLDLFPGISELMGLLALFLIQHSRRAARIADDGQLVTLAEQDRSLWDHVQIAEARVLLEKALRHRSPGSYQIQAAIGAVHASAIEPETTDWEEIERLYRALYIFEPTPVVKLNHASAVAQTQGARAALEMLEPIADQLAGYRWYHTARAAFHVELGELKKAKSAYRQALTLNPTREEQRVIEEQIIACEKNAHPV